MYHTSSSAENIQQVPFSFGEQRVRNYGKHLSITPNLLNIIQYDIEQIWCYRVDLILRVKE